MKEGFSGIMGSCKQEGVVWLGGGCEKGEEQWF